MFFKLIRNDHATHYGPFWLPAAVPIVFIATIIWLGEFGYTSSWKLTVLANALIRYVADWLPSNPVVLWCSVIAVLAAAYQLAERAFLRAQTHFGGTDK